MSFPEPVYPDGPFPVEPLIVQAGTWFGAAHRNNYTTLHMDWHFGVGFEPLIVGSDTYHTGLSMDLECNDVRRIEQLVGKEWHDTSKDCNIGSFYLDGWRESRESRVRVHGMRGTILDVEMEVLVDVIDSYIDPDPPLRRIHVRAELEFNGIAVSSYSVQSEPDDEKLMNIARQLFDVSAFAPPVRSEEKLSDGRHYVDLKFFPPA